MTGHAPLGNIMKHGIRFSLISILVVCAARHASAQDDGQQPAPAMLELFNRDLMRGSLVGIDPEAGALTWLNPAAKQPIRFRLGAVQRMVRPGISTSEAGAAGNDTLVMANGDQLNGRLVAIDADTVTLDTPYAGRLAFRRDMVARVGMNQAASPLIYAGPRSLAQWVIEDRADGWVLEDNAFVARVNAPMGRRFDELPDRCYIAFDMEWSGFLNATFAFFMTELRQQDSQGYRLVFNRNTVRLATSEEDRMSYHGHRAVAMRSGMGDGTTRVELFIDHEARSVTLVLDRGLLKQTWTDLEPLAQRGDGIVFIPQNPGVMKFGHIRIENWDGETFERRDPVPALAQDVLHLANEDMLSGRVVSITDGNVRFDASFSSFEISMENVAELVFAAEGMKRASIKPGDARVGLEGAGHMTLRRIQVADGALTGTSEIFGTVSVSAALLQSLYFYRDGE